MWLLSRNVIEPKGTIMARTIILPLRTQDRQRRGSSPQRDTGTWGERLSPRGLEKTKKNCKSTTWSYEQWLFL